MLKFNYQPKITPHTPTNLIPKNKKRSTSQIKYQKAPDIMTQAKPSYLNNFVQPINPHQSAFTPTNRSKNLEQNKLLLPQKSHEFSNKKTLILDLDETLVHSSFVPFEKNDIILNVDFESVMYNIYVMVRPGAIEFLKKVSKYFEVIIFTASIAKYALPLLDILDQEKKIKYILTREHCTFLNGIYIKELKKLNRNLKDLIIVDNSPLAYAFDSDNGLPIKTWYEDKKDKELEKIFPILEFLSKTKDVRMYINKFVKNNEIIYDTANELIKNINEKNKTNNNNKNIISNNNNTNNNNITNDNKDEIERKAISVNINVNIKNKVKNNEINNNNDNSDNNNINSNSNNNKVVQNINTNKVVNKDKDNNNKKINERQTNNILINKIINDKKDMSYSINSISNNSNYNINKNNSKNKKNLKNIIMNKKISKDISNSKQNILIQKKKNSFRTGPKLGDKIPFKNLSNTNNNVHINNFINNAKYPINNNENDFSLGLSLSNTTKNKFSSKAQIKYNSNNDKNNTINKSKKKDQFLLQKNIFYDKDNSLNNNYIFKKYKYTNLLEKLENKTMKSNYSLNNKSQNINKSINIFKDKTILQKKKFNNHKNNKKINHIRASSSLIEKYQALIINNSTNDNKLNNNSQVSRSKSTGNFINFTKKIQKPKTPKGQFIFEKKILVGSNKEIKKNKKGLNMMNGFSKTTRLINNKQFV